MTSGPNSWLQIPDYKQFPWNKIDRPAICRERSKDLILQLLGIHLARHGARKVLLARPWFQWAKVCVWEVRVGLWRSQTCEGPSGWEQQSLDLQKASLFHDLQKQYVAGLLWPSLTIFNPGILEANSQHQPSQPASLQDQGGFFIGTSPEWQLAVGTVAYFETSTPGPWAQLSHKKSQRSTGDQY
jgi:hypothetical protein